jgi:4'-phosphopantetheinyl transferase EntD
MNGAASESLAQLAPLVMNLFPWGVVAMQTQAEVSGESLLPAERVSVGRAVEKRVREFAAGRLCARHAIKALDLGMEETPLLPQEDRSPRWPDAVVGSITHTEGFCTAVAAAKSRFAGLGVDAERVQNVSCELWPQILRCEELDRLLQLEVTVRQRTAAVIFCQRSLS